MFENVIKYEQREADGKLVSFDVTVNWWEADEILGSGQKQSYVSDFTTELDKDSVEAIDAVTGDDVEWSGNVYDLVSEEEMLNDAIEQLR